MARNNNSFRGANKLKRDYIYERVLWVQKKYGKIEPKKLAKDMGIIVSYEPMGNTDKSCKGFFVVFCRKKHITINSNLKYEVQRIILMHEIAHAVLHFGPLCSAFHDFAIFDNTDIKEYEANMFTADYLVSDNEVFDTIKEDVSFFDAASILNIPPELLDFKFRLMKRRGFKIVEPPITSTGDFLKNIK
jgi:Zn-dependent peptidase ImmA (M78 family)